MKKLSTLIIFFHFCLLTAITFIHAEEDGFSSTFLPQFPKNGTYKLVILGDNFAEDLHEGILHSLKNDQKVEISPKYFSLTGLLRNNGEDKLNSVEEFLRSETPNIALIMMGSSDRISARDATGKRIAFGSLEWRNEYKKKLDNFLKFFKNNKIAVYMLGMPAFRNSEDNDYVRTLNDIFRENAYLNGIKYIDTYDSFLDDAGNYSAWGPDLNGKIIKIRDTDGQGFTKAGNLMLSHMIEKELRRDIKEVEAVRLEPLAGNESEQIKVNPDKPIIKNAEKDISQFSHLERSKERTLKNFIEEDIAADNQKVMVKLNKKLVREEETSIEILRPALSSRIVSLIAQKETQNKQIAINDKLATYLSNGLMAFNTINLPSMETNADQMKKLSPSQNSFYKLLIKGERLPPKAGRADDLRWPNSD